MDSISFVLTIILTLFFTLLLNTFIHELGHKFAILTTSKKCNYILKEKIKIKIGLCRGFTSSDFYSYLNNNKRSNIIQDIIRINAISGFSATIIIYILILFLYLLYQLFLSFLNKVFDYKIIIIFMLFSFIWLAISYISLLYYGNDWKTFKDPVSFEYKPK